jgi:hypothetical protein
VELTIIIAKFVAAMAAVGICVLALFGVRR